MASISFQKNGVDINNLTLTPADFTNGMWHSDEVTTTNDNRVTANITYGALTPDGANVAVDYRLQAILEGQESNGDWVSLCRQFTPMFRSENALVRRLIATSGPTAYDPDFAHIIPDALGNEAVEISVSDVDIPDKVRICLTLADRNAGGQDLTSFTVTMTGSIVS